MLCLLPRLRLLLVLAGVPAMGLSATAGRAASGSAFDHARPAIRVYGVEDGLPGTTVYALTLDSRGRLWAGTASGLAYLTGSGWTSVNLPPECPSRFVRAILEGKDGSLWVGTEGGGLWRLKDGAWTGFRAGRELPHDGVNCLLETASPTGKVVLWVGTAGGGIARLEDGHWTVHNQASGLKGEWVWKVREILEPDGAVRIWAATMSGLSVLDGSHWRSIGPEQGFRGTNCNDLIGVTEPGGRRSMWVSCWGLGLARWDGFTWEHMGPSEGFPSRHPCSLSATTGPGGEPVIWAGTYSEGLAWKASGPWQSLSAEKGFPATGVLAILPVPNGKPDIWTGTRGGGVATLDLGGWRTLDEKLGLPSDEANCFAEAIGPGGEHLFWIGTSRGLAEWEDGRLVPHDAIGGPPASYLSDLLAVPARDGGYVLWAATLEGLFKRERGSWQRVGREVGLPEERTLCLLDVKEPSGRTLWVGSQNGLGCLRNGKWRLYTTADGLNHDWVNALVATVEPDGSQAIWTATRGGGVGRFRNGRWSAWGRTQGLLNQNVNGLTSTRSADGRLWIWAASTGGGLSRLEADKPGARWETFSTTNLPLLPSDSVMGLELDRMGRLYLATARGVARITLRERNGVPSPARVEAFTRGDGLPSSTCMVNPSFLDRQGRVWIGTVQGAAVLDLALETKAPPPPMPAFDRLQVMGRDRPLTPGMRFGFRDQRITFEFSIPTFHRSEDTLYRSQLKGLEVEPTRWRKAGQRELTGLAAGDYVLAVWAMDFAGRESGPAELAFVVRPAPWRSWWAFMVYAMALVGSGAVYLRARTRHLHQRTVELAAAVAERTRTVEQQRLDLEDANRNLVLLNQNLRQLNDRNEALIREMAAALEEVKTLRGFIPICAYCKKVRDDSGYWEQLEAYIGQHSEATFSHGVCPECYAKVLQPQIEDLKRRKTPA